MSTIYTFETESLEEQATLIKNILIQFMALNDMIDKEVYENLLNNYAIIIRKPTFLLDYL